MCTKKWCSLSAAVVLTVHCVLLGWSAYRHSPVVCESAHLPAGLSHLELGRYDLYRVNPPCVRMLAAITASWAGAQTDWSRYDTDPHHRAEFQVGEDFVRANGERTFWLFTVARWGCIPLSLIGAITCLVWADALYGRPAGIVATILWCFSPSILGHGALITPDVGAAALGVAACFAFWYWLKHPTWQGATLAGCALGIAELTKTTLLIFYVVLPIVWWISRSKSTDKMHPRFAQLVFLLALSIMVINMGYNFEGSFRSLGSYQFQSQLFSGQTNDEDGSRVLGNRLSPSLGWMLVPLPENYLQGIDTQRVDFERKLRSYLQGEWRNGGWWYFYLYALAVKLPLGTWSLVLMTIFLVTSRPEYRASLANEFAVLLPGVAILVLVSSQTGFSIHPRYLLPAMPFVFIAISRLVRASFLGHARLSLVVQSAIVFSVTSSVWVCPHSLSYFNELAGGPRHGHHHLVDSAIGWGQDLLYLRDWVQKNPEAQNLSVAAFGYVNPRLADIQFTLPPLGPTGPLSAGTMTPLSPSLGPLPGWFAVDVNHVLGTSTPVIDPLGRQRKLTSPVANFTYFRHFTPVATVGYSIWIYRISLVEANRVRAELGLRPLPTDIPDSKTDIASL